MTSSSRRSGIKLNRPFVGIPSFLRARIETDLDALDADIAVYGVPFDEGSPFLAGSRMGPRSIREHSLNRVMTMGEFHAVGPKGVAEVVPRDARAYVSIDIDVLDLPLIPGCVSAEPNGMSYAELRDTLAAIAEHCEVVGLDLVEVNPTLDVGTGITSYLAAHTVLEFLGNICRQPRWERHREARAAARG